MSDLATIYEVSPVFYDDSLPDGGPKFADRSGYRFICPDCGWKSPVMKWMVGAIRHLNEHATGDGNGCGFESPCVCGDTGPPVRLPYANSHRVGWFCPSCGRRRDPS